MQFWDKHFCVYQVTFLKCGTMRYVCVSFLPLAGADGRKGTRVHRPSLPPSEVVVYVRTYLREKKNKKKENRPVIIIWWQCVDNGASSTIYHLFLVI